MKRKLKFAIVLKHKNKNNFSKDNGTHNPSIT